MKLYDAEKTCSLEEFVEVINDLANGDSMYQARHYFRAYRYRGGKRSFKEITGKSFYSKNSWEAK